MARGMMGGLLAAVGQLRSPPAQGRMRARAIAAKALTKLRATSRLCTQYVPT